MLPPILRQFLFASATLTAALVAALPAVSSPQESASAPRLLTPKEGRSVVAAAWEHREQVRRKPDCSHLVHQVYEFAGFPYSYASSFDVYDGTASFRRVNTARAGDLVVWPGHVGIVVDPVERTFYSSVRSGLHTESYDGPYWRAQGRPRFFRYIRRSGGTLVAAKTSPSASRASSSEPRARPAASSAREEPSGDAPADSSAEEADSAAPTLDPISPDRPVEIPSSILVVTPAANRPTAEEVSDAFSELTSAHGKLLRSGPPLDPARAIAVYDQLTVERLEFKRDRSWAHVRIATRLSIGGEKLDSKRRREKLRLELRRTAQGWQLLAPPNRAYVPRDVAVHMLATQLALITQGINAPDDRGWRPYLIVRALASLVEPE